MNECDKAAEYHRLSLEMKKRIHGENNDHPDIAVSLKDLGSIYQAMNEYDKAKEYQRLSLEMHKRIHSETSDNSDIARSLNNLDNA